jgi:Transglycosylase/AsmA family
MIITKKGFFWFFLSLLLFLGLLVVGLFFFRESLLQQAIGKVETKFKKDFNCDFKIKTATFEGLSGLAIKDITLVPLEADTLLSIQKIKTKINLMQLLTGDVQIDNLELQNGYIQLVKNKKGKNFDAFLKSKQEDTISDEKKDYAEFAYRLISKALDLIPERIHLENMSIKLDDMGNKVVLQTNKLQLKNHQLASTINVTTNTFTQKWSISGMANPRDEKADIQIKNSDSSKIRLPYIDQKFKIPTSFDNLHFKLDKIDMSFGNLHIDGFASVENLTLNNYRIANKDVVFRKMSMDYRFLLGEEFIALDTATVVKLNDLKMKPYLEYNSEKDKIYTLKLNIKQTKAQDFINSLPEGLFSHFEGMQAIGTFDYKLSFKYNKNKPWLMVFNSNLNKQGLRITKYGQANLAKLNSEFTYRAVENGRLQRPVLVGLENQFYTPLSQISPFLQKSVLTCEDPSFMTHRGFINEAFRQSIIKNIRTKKFARGASTISMQLIKNVFLTREKTLSRKLEEILLVYILENNRIASKERMLEVYFNVIEWGPNVYGIGEASMFYFQKRPIDLSLQECSFLASIVPKPKKFMYLFDNLGNLKLAPSKHQELIRNIMLRRGLLLPEDTIGQKVPIAISGQARKHMTFKVIDPVKLDSLELGDF